MTQHIDALPDSYLVTTVNALRTDLDTLKAAQRSGARSLQTYINQNLAGSDFNQTLSSGTTATTIITFTAAVQKYALADLTFRIYANSLSSEVHPDLTATNLWPNPKVTLLPPSVASQLVTTWSMKLFGIGSAGSNTFYVKLYVLATDVGVIAP